MYVYTHTYIIHMYICYMLFTDYMQLSNLWLYKCEMALCIFPVTTFKSAMSNPLSYLLMTSRTASMIFLTGLSH
jgi:hypothetical protein